MQSYTFSFIGVGNMGGALARAAVKKLPPEQVFLSNRTFEKAEALAAELGCAAGPADRAARDGKFIFLGVKPQMMADLLAEIGPVLAERTDRFLLVTMAAGLTMARIAALAGGEYPVIRIMPNTPCAVGAGVVLCDANPLVTARELEEFSAALAGAGVIDRLDESLIDGAYTRCEEILNAHRAELELVAEYLLKYENMDAETFALVFTDPGAVKPPKDFGQPEQKPAPQAADHPEGKEPGHVDH